MRRLTPYCIPCGENGRPVEATTEVDGDPMCAACAKRALPAVATSEEPRELRGRARVSGTFQVGKPVSRALLTTRRKRPPSRYQVIVDDLLKLEKGQALPVAFSSKAASASALNGLTRLLRDRKKGERLRHRRRGQDELTVCFWIEAKAESGAA